MVGKHASKLGLLNAQGIRTALLSEIGADAEADIVVDATGSDSGLTTALRLVRPRGTVVLKTTVAGSQTLALAPVVVDEVTVVGSRCGSGPGAARIRRRVGAAADFQPIRAVAWS